MLVVPPLPPLAVPLFTITRSITRLRTGSISWKGMPNPLAVMKPLTWSRRSVAISSFPRPPRWKSLSA